MCQHYYYNIFVLRIGYVTLSDDYIFLLFFRFGSKTDGPNGVSARRQWAETLRTTCIMIKVGFNVYLYSYRHSVIKHCTHPKTFPRWHEFFQLVLKTYT